MVGWNRSEPAVWARRLTRLNEVIVANDKRGDEIMRRCCLIA